MERDYFMTSDEAREYGIIDQVIATSRKASVGHPDSVGK
jgi:ATP-dependent protease ClpP protease subunit